MAAGRQVKGNVPVTVVIPAEAECMGFRETVYAAVRQCHRRLPWRETVDPYRVLVSEIMLQQTQVERVVPKYLAFLERFPDATSLAVAPLAEVLAAWQGLGYNRRAIALKRAAEEVVARFGGTVPASDVELLSLPGIGPYTAGAIAAFAFDQPAVFIETNIRSVFLHHFFPGRDGVHDRELLPLVAATIDREGPRRWYNALMDYGAWLKTLHQNPSRRSRHHVRQAPFAGSNRQLRGQVLKCLLARPGGDAAELAAALAVDAGRLEPVLARLTGEGLIREDEGRYHAG